MTRGRVVPRARAVARGLPRLVLVAAASACADVSGDAATADPPAPPPLVGTWRLLDVVQGDSTDATHPFGASAEGYLVYDPTGHVFVHVRRRLADDVPRRVWTDAPRAHLLEIVESYAASFGTYAVDSAARVVTHAIEGESPPATGVLERATPYELRGDTLRIGVGTHRRWTFVRVR